MNSSLPFRPRRLLSWFSGALIFTAIAAAQDSRPASRPVGASEAFLLPEPIASFGAALVGDELFVVGGHVGKTHAHSRANVTPSIRRRSLNPAAKWRTDAAPALQGLALVAHENAVIRIGGLEPRNATGDEEDLWSVASVERRARDGSAWEALPPLPSPRSSHDAVIAGGSIVVAGGWTLAGTASTWADEAFTLDLANPSRGWTRIPQPFRRRALALAATRGRIFAIGGIDEDGEPSPRVDVYDLATGSWSRGPDLPKPGFGAAAHGDDSLLVTSAMDGRILRLAATEDVWSAIGALAVPRFFHRILREPGGALLFVGGAGRDGHLRLVERFDPAADPTAPRWVRCRIPWPGAAKNRQAAILGDGALVLIGGNKSLGQHDFAPENFLDEAWRLELGALEAARLEPLPARRQSLVVAEPPRVSRENGAGEKTCEPVPVSMFGGFGSEKPGAERTFADAFRYEKGNPIAAAQPALPEPLTQFGVAVHAGATWIFGGMDYDASRGDEDAFRHSDKIWVSRAGGAFENAGTRMPSARRAFGHAVHGDRFYAAGGLEDGFKVVDEFVAFDFAAREWRSLAKPAPRISPELVAMDDALWLAGGSNRTSPPPFLERYDPSTDSWTTVASEPPFDPVHVRAAAHRGRLLFWSTHRKVAVLDLAWLVLPPR